MQPVSPKLSAAWGRATAKRDELRCGEWLLASTEIHDMHDGTLKVIAEVNSKDIRDWHLQMNATTPRVVMQNVNDSQVRALRIGIEDEIVGWGNAMGFGITITNSARHTPDVTTPAPAREPSHSPAQTRATKSRRRIVLDEEPAPQALAGETTAPEILKPVSPKFVPPPAPAPPSRAEFRPAPISADDRENGVVDKLLCHRRAIEGPNMVPLVRMAEEETRLRAQYGRDVEFEWDMSVAYVFVTIRRSGRARLNDVGKRIDAARTRL